MKNFQLKYELSVVLRMKDDRLPKIFLFSQPSRATRKAGRPRLGWENFIYKDLKRGTLNILVWRRNVPTCVGHRRLVAVVSYY